MKGHKLDQCFFLWAAQHYIITMCVGEGCMQNGFFNICLGVSYLSPDVCMCVGAGRCPIMGFLPPLPV